MMKKPIAKFALLSLALVLALGSVLRGEQGAAQKFDDDFSKPELSAAWNAGAGLWYVEAGMLKCRPTPPAAVRTIDKVLTCKAVTLTSSFTLSADVRLDVNDSAHWAGVAFHIQDPKNFYAFRIVAAPSNGFYQVLKVVDGVPVALKYAELKCQAEIFYTLVVQCKEDGAWKFTVRDGSTILLELDDVVRDRDKTFTAGQAGLYIGDTSCTFEKFHLETAAAADAGK